MAPTPASIIPFEAGLRPSLIDEFEIEPEIDTDVHNANIVVLKQDFPKSPYAIPYPTFLNSPSI